MKTRSKYDTKKIYKGKKTSKETKTIPNEALTVRQMLIKNANGTLYDNLKTPYYEEQATFSTKPLNIIQNMNEMEKIDYLNEVTEEANALKLKVQSEIQRKQEEQAQNEMEAQRTASSEPSSE